MSRNALQFSSRLTSICVCDLTRQLLPAQVADLLQLNGTPPKLRCSPKRGVISYTFPGKQGYLKVKEDGIRIVIRAFNHSPQQARDQLLFLGALRDRQLDGTAHTSPLTTFSNADPAINRPPFANFLGTELSVYSWHPDHFLPHREKLNTVAHFIVNPDYYIWKNCRPFVLGLWQQAVALNRAPWQRSLPIPGAASTFVKNSAALLKQLGYHRLDTVPSWYNVANFFERQGFHFTYGEHAAAYKQIGESLQASPSFAKATLQRQAWLVALQNLPDDMIDPELRLSARWPVTHTNGYWVRMHLDLNPADGGPGGQKNAKLSQLRQQTKEAFLATTS